MEGGPPDRGESFGATCDICREYFTARYDDEYGTPKRCPDCDEEYQSMDWASGVLRIRDDETREEVTEALEAGLSDDYGVWAKNDRIGEIRIYHDT